MLYLVICISIRSINKLEYAHVLDQQCVPCRAFQSYNVCALLKKAIKCLHWSICKTKQIYTMEMMRRQYTTYWSTLLYLFSFHGAFATGVASQQGTLTLLDTWFRPPFWDLLMLQLLRPNSSNLPCLYSTFHLEYPLVLSFLSYNNKFGYVIKAIDS